MSFPFARRRLARLAAAFTFLLLIAGPAGPSLAVAVAPAHALAPLPADSGAGHPATDGIGAAASLDSRQPSAGAVDPATAWQLSALGCAFGGWIALVARRWIA